MPALRLSNGTLTEPYDGSFGVGKWDRFMTPGPKTQAGVDFDFNEANLAQIVHNFARVYSMRRLPLDYRHLAAVAAENVQAPEQSLAYYNALAVIWAGRVVEFWSQDPAQSPPVVADLLATLQAKFPRVTSADGLWGFKCEVTPLGVEKLPNMEQLSPLFSKDDTDEQGRPIGYNLLNVSAVNVAFQNGTLINLGRRTVAAHALRKDMIPEHLQEKLMKHGMGEDGDGESMRKAFAAYMALTDDPKEIRSEMARAMGDVKIEHDAMGKMADGDDKKDEEDSSSDKSASMAKKLRGDADEDPAVKKLLNDLTGKLSAMGKRVDHYEHLERERALAEYMAFAKQRNVSEEDAREYLTFSHNDLAYARRLVAKHPEVTTMSRMTQAGAPVGKSPIALSDADAAPTVRAGNKDAILHGYALSKKATELVDKMAGKTTFEKLAAAQRQVAQQHPALYK